jgi:hypothetical protein
MRFIALNALLFEELFYAFFQLRRRVSLVHDEVVATEESRVNFNPRLL